jgi:hypothetical protein
MPLNFRRIGFIKNYVRFPGNRQAALLLQEKKNKINAAIYNRNTKPNKEAGPIVYKMHDMVVVTSGIPGFSKIQWKKLTDGLLKRKIIYDKLSRRKDQ